MASRTLNDMPRWTDPNPVVFHPERQRAQAGQCVYFGHPAAPRCTNPAQPGSELCTEHPHRF